MGVCFKRNDVFFVSLWKNQRKKIHETSWNLAKVPMIATVRGAGGLEVFPSAAALVFSTRRHGMAWPNLRLISHRVHRVHRDPTKGEVAWHDMAKPTKKYTIWHGYDMDMTCSSPPSPLRRWLEIDPMCLATGSLDYRVTTKMAKKAETCWKNAELMIIDDY